MTTTASTGHEVTVDAVQGWVRIAGDLDTVQQIPDAEIEAACAAAGVRCTWEALDAQTYGCVSVEEEARAAGRAWAEREAEAMIGAPYGAWLSTEIDARPLVSHCDLAVIANEAAAERWAEIVAACAC